MTNAFCFWCGSTWKISGDFGDFVDNGWATDKIKGKWCVDMSHRCPNEECFGELEGLETGHSGNSESNIGL